jgi:flagellar biosynthetic protein FlhB
MAGEKTEKPTTKRVKEARDKGQVPRSRDLTGAASLLVVVGALAWLGPHVIAGLTDRLTSALAAIGQRPTASISLADLTTIIRTDAWRLVALTAPLTVAAGATAVAANFAQVGWVFAPQALQLNWNRLNPSNNIKRFVPSQAGVDLLKAVLGVATMSALGWQVGSVLCTQAFELTSMSPASLGVRAWDVLWRLVGRGGLTILVFAAADYGVQRWRTMTSLKMTRQELKDEHRSNEGSPEIRGRVRKIQREMAKRRMLAAVKKATVVIVNPTHVAVALEYRRERMVAPVVLAKGQDHLALRIRTIAREAGVPIVENISLARALYAGADVGDTIPAALFGAIAEVLAYLVRIKQLVL